MFITTHITHLHSTYCTTCLLLPISHTYIQHTALHVYYYLYHTPTFNIPHYKFITTYITHPHSTYHTCLLLLVSHTYIQHTALHVYYYLYHTPTFNIPLQAYYYLYHTPTFNIPHFMFITTCITHLHSTYCTTCLLLPISQTHIQHTALQAYYYLYHTPTFNILHYMFITTCITHLHSTYCTTCLLLPISHTHIQHTALLPISCSTYKQLTGSVPSNHTPVCHSVLITAGQEVLKREISTELLLNSNTQTAVPRSSHKRKNPKIIICKQ